MRIHSDYLTPADVHAVISDLPGVYAEVTRHGSRVRSGALEVRLTGTSPYRTMDGEDQAATWDEWGVMMARLFNLDANALMHKETRSEFELRTGDRFESLTMPSDTHPRHRWEFVAPREFKCSKCPATMAR